MQKGISFLLVYIILLGSVFSQITYNSVQSGGFLNSNTWDQPTAPITSSNNIINIKAGHTVDINNFTTFSGTTMINIESGGTLMANFANFQLLSNAHLINQGTINTDAQIVVRGDAMLDNTGIINMNATIGIGLLLQSNATVTNENEINLLNNSSIQLSDVDNVFTNTGVINISDNSVIYLNDGTFITCNPPPVFSDLPFPNTGNNGSRIYDGGDGSLIAGEECYVAPVPTVGQWGVLMLFLGSIILGVIKIRSINFVTW